MQVLKKIIGYVLFFFCFISVIYLFNTYANSGIEGTLEEIRREYEGIIIDRYAARKYTGATDLKIRTINNLNIDVTPINKLIEYTRVGDSIIKIKNENIIIIKKPNGETKQFFSCWIPTYVAEHKDYPKEWRGKWKASIKPPRK